VRIYTVLVTDKALGGTVPYGSFRSPERARAAEGLFRDPQSVDYRDPSEWDVRVAILEPSPFA
jgi:hypothetical protein